MSWPGTGPFEREEKFEAWSEEKAVLKMQAAARGALLGLSGFVPVLYPIRNLVPV